MGLSDFHYKYGKGPPSDTIESMYEWYDQAAYNYAVPELKKQYDIDVKYNGKNNLDEYWDNSRMYYKKLESIPEYITILKNKVIIDIIYDPIWYAHILYKRLLRIVNNTTPISIFLPNYIFYTFSFHWILYVAIIIFSILTKQWDMFKFNLFLLPTSLGSLLVYSGMGMVWFSMFHISCIAYWIYILYEIINFYILKLFLILKAS